MVYVDIEMSVKRNLMHLPRLCDHVTSHSESVIVVCPACVIESAVVTKCLASVELYTQYLWLSLAEESCSYKDFEDIV